MRTVPVDQTDLTVTITKQHQILAEDADRHHRPVAGKFIRQRNRLPVKPHKRATPGAVIGFCQLSVDLVGKHVISNLKF